MVKVRTEWASSVLPLVFLRLVMRAEVNRAGRKAVVELGRAEAWHKAWL